MAAHRPRRYVVALRDLSVVPTAPDGSIHLLLPGGELRGVLSLGPAQPVRGPGRVDPSFAGVRRPDRGDEVGWTRSFRDEREGAEDHGRRDHRRILGTTVRDDPGPGLA